jgi:hypothetical protein
MKQGKDILSMYGRDSHMPQARRASSGGKTMADKCDVMDYQPPQGPTNINNRQVGLGGDNYGNCGTQGQKAIHRAEGGSAGLHGKDRGMGTNRRG